MTYKTRDRIRWAMALCACLFAIFGCVNLKYTILITWAAADFHRPDERNMERCLAIPRNMILTYCEIGQHIARFVRQLYRLAVQLVQKRA